METRLKRSLILSSTLLQWARYMLCDGSPDPKVTKEINTYINLWREDTDSKPVHKIIQECHDALKVRQASMHIHVL